MRRHAFTITLSLMRRAVKRVLIEVNQKHQNAAGAFRVRGFIIKEIS
jgi:hypothetical protein